MIFDQAYLEHDGVLIHRTANIVGSPKIGKGTRIDAFVTITGDVEIGQFSHIGTMACIFGGAGVFIGDYCGVSPGAKVFSATEDDSGEWLTNPTVPKHLRNPKSSRIVIADHSLVGANSILLPGANLPEGCVVGALSLVKNHLMPWSIWAGVPVIWRKSRSQKAKDLVSNNVPAIREKVA